MFYSRTLTNRQRKMCAAQAKNWPRTGGRQAASHAVSTITYDVAEKISPFFKKTPLAPNHPWEERNDVQTATTKQTSVITKRTGNHESQDQHQGRLARVSVRLLNSPSFNTKRGLESRRNRLEALF